LGFYKFKTLFFPSSLCLNNVLFVPSLRRNLVSSSLLDIAGFEANQKVGRVVILRNGAFFGWGIVVGGTLF